MHETFALPGVLYETGTSKPSVPDNVVTLRIHDKEKLVGDLAGTNLNYAETVERPTQAIFQTADLVGHDIRRGSMVIMFDYMGSPVGYFIDNVHPADGLTTSCDVTPLSASELSGRLLPTGCKVP